MQIVHCKKFPCDVYIGRKKEGMHFGNPWSFKDGLGIKVADRKTAIKNFRTWLFGYGFQYTETERRKWILDNIEQLRGKTLGCFCDYPTEDCHGSVYLEYLNLKEYSFSKANFKLAVIGSRTFTDYKLLCSTLDKYEISAIVSGGADGADSLGQRYAKDKGLKILIIYPNWNKDGKSAGFKRNREIIEKCDKVVAFWQNDSKGTANSISIAKELNKEVEVIKC